MATNKPREAPRKPGRARTRRNEPPKAPAVQVHAHRGGAALAPENTMEAFDRAVQLGVHFVELDVRTCASGELVVIHDADLQRLAGSSARVSELSLLDLQQADVGSHFSPDFAGARVPTLLEVLETHRNSVRFNVEIKEDHARGDGTAEAVARLIESMDLVRDAVVSSFNPGSLARVRRLSRVPLGLVYPMDGGKGIAGRIRDRLMRNPWSAPLVSVYALHPRETLVTAELVSKAHLRGLAVNTWTVNDEVRMRELAKLRVTGLITDRPDVALRVTGEVDPLQRQAPGLPEEA